MEHFVLPVQESKFTCLLLMKARKLVEKVHQKEQANLPLLEQAWAGGGIVKGRGLAIATPKPPTLNTNRQGKALPQLQALACNKQKARIMRAFCLFVDYFFLLRSRHFTSDYLPEMLRIALQAGSSAFHPRCIGGQVS